MEGKVGVLGSFIDQKWPFMSKGNFGLVVKNKMKEIIIPKENYFADNICQLLFHSLMIDFKRNCLTIVDNWLKEIMSRFIEDYFCPIFFRKKFLWY